MMDGLQVGARAKTWIRGRSWPFHVMLVTACLIVGVPLLYAAMISTQTNGEVFAFKLGPGSALASNFHDVWVTRRIAVNMWNSTQQAVLVTIGKTVLSLTAGLAFVYFRFRGKWIVFFFVLITLMMPTDVMVLAMFKLVSSFNWQDTMAALVVPFLASATGAFLFRQHFANLPSDLLDAALIDGVTPLQFLFRVLVPLSWNVMGALAVIQFVYTWNMYLWPRLIIQNDQKQVVQVALQSLQNIDGGLTYGPLMLAAVLSSIPPALVFLALQKPFMSGFAIGQDK